MLEGSILQKLEVAHQSGEAGKRPLSFGVYYKNTLVALCHALEDCILTSNTAPLVITAFQRGKWYLQEADRYGDLAERSRQVVIMASPDTGFAEHPTSQRSNVALVHLDSADPVAQEWHLMILSPSYTAMVLCQELSAADYGAQGQPTEDRERKFYGFWTFEPGLVQETIEIAIDHIHCSQPELAQALKAHVQAIVAEAATTPPDDLTAVVSRVVDYLKTGQADLGTASDYSHPDILDDNLVSNELQAFLRLAQLSDLTDLKNPMAAAEVATLAEMMGQLLDLPAWQLHRLRLAGLLHRIAPLQAADSLLSSTYRSSEGESYPLTCPLVPGIQALRTMPRLRAIATIINHQTEYWNGSGQPAGLAGDEIPLESRILGLVADFQQQATQLRTAALDGDMPPRSPEESLSQALAACQTQQGERWDPKLIETLALLVCGIQQGLSIPTLSHRITSGLWLLDACTNSEEGDTHNSLIEVSDRVGGGSYGH